MRNGAFDYLAKPFDLEQAAAVIDRALAIARADAGAAIRQLSGEQVAAHELLGSGPAMQEVFKRIALVAADRLLGADHRRKRHRQGTGRPGDPSPFVARGPAVRADQPGFAQPDAGRERAVRPRAGAFTGADAARQGLLELADGATVFFDEAGDIPPSVQVKLLRVLEQHEVTPVGDTQPRASDFRVIAATNRELRREFHSGDFRQDLYFRLAVFEIHLPPLRERVEDIPLLAERFLSQRFSPTASRASRFTPRRWPSCAGGLARQRPRAAQCRRAWRPAGPRRRDRPRTSAAAA